MPEGASPLRLFPSLSPRILASAPISLFSSLLPVSDLHHPPPLAFTMVEGWAMVSSRSIQIPLS